MAELFEPVPENGRDSHAIDVDPFNPLNPLPPRSFSGKCRIHGKLTLKCCLPTNILLLTFNCLSLRWKKYEVWAKTSDQTRWKSIKATRWINLFSLLQRFLVCLNGFCIFKMFSKNQKLSLRISEGISASLWFPHKHDQNGRVLYLKKSKL